MTLITRRRSLALLAAIPFGAHATERYYLNGEGVALRGYDPVAYFEDEVAIRGSLQHEASWDGARWRFETERSREVFLEDPERFQPEYGGFCAEGVARGFLRISDPTVWVMVNGRLFFHYTVAAQNRWADDIRGNMRTGDENWPGLRALAY